MQRLGACSIKAARFLFQEEPVAKHNRYFCYSLPPALWLSGSGWSGAVLSPGEY